MRGDSRLIWVCDACLRASCWNGEFYCDDFKVAGLRQMSMRQLRKLKLEHPDNWNRPWNADRRGQWQAKSAGG